MLINTDSGEFRMRIKYLQHESFEGPGYIADWAQTNNHTIEGVMLYKNEALPSSDSFDLLVVMGGPMGVFDTEKFPWLENEKKFLKASIESGKAVLGICLGAQLLADSLGAPVTRNRYREIGWYEVIKSAEADESEFGKVLPRSFMAFHWHSDRFELPPGGYHIGYTDGCYNQGFVWKNRVVGLQFHNEVTAASVKDLSAACAAEIERSKFVQPVEKITDAIHVPAANSVMDSILTFMEAAAVA
jgi:GMP synthase (glutamine-hydrolysing)